MVGEPQFIPFSGILWYWRYHSIYDDKLHFALSCAKWFLCRYSPKLGKGSKNSATVDTQTECMCENLICLLCLPLVYMYNDEAELLGASVEGY